MSGCQALTMGGRRRTRYKRKKTRRKKTKKRRKSRKKKFKKHFMWNTKGKRYVAKTYKQHIRGVKLGHTHKKPKRRRRIQKGGEEVEI